MIVKKIEIYVRVVTIQIEKKYTINEKKRKTDNSVKIIEKPKMIMLTMMFQHMKTIVMSLSVLAT